MFRRCQLGPILLEAGMGRSMERKEALNNDCGGQRDSAVIKELALYVTYM